MSTKLADNSNFETNIKEIQEMIKVLSEHFTKETKILEIPYKVFT